MKYQRRFLILDLFLGEFLYRKVIQEKIIWTKFEGKECPTGVFLIKCLNGDLLRVYSAKGSFMYPDKSGDILPSDMIAQYCMLDDSNTEEIKKDD